MHSLQFCMAQWSCNLFTYLRLILKAKAVPLHTTKALGGRGSIAPSYSRPNSRWGWVVSVTTWPRFSPGERTPVPIVQEAGWAPEPVWTQATGKIICLCLRSNLDPPVVQPVARHYTDWATRLTLRLIQRRIIPYTDILKAVNVLRCSGFWRRAYSWVYRYIPTFLRNVLPPSSKRHNREQDRQTKLSQMIE
jgi:hypothetical protein